MAKTTKWWFFWRRFSSLYFYFCLISLTLHQIENFFFFLLKRKLLQNRRCVHLLIVWFEEHLTFCLFLFLKLIVRIILKVFYVIPFVPIGKNRYFFSKNRKPLFWGDEKTFSFFQWWKPYFKYSSDKDLIFWKSMKKIGLISLENSK